MPKSLGSHGTFCLILEAKKEILVTMKNIYCVLNVLGKSQKKAVILKLPLFMYFPIMMC